MINNKTSGHLTKLTNLRQKDDALGFLSTDFKSFYIHPVEGEVNGEDGGDRYRRYLIHPRHSLLDELFGVITEPRFLENR
jgi:hypothetical protein